MANFTKQAIETAFLQLLNEKPLNKISVRDIVEKCGINRNSFYYHFQDIPSLIAEIITSYTDQLIEEYPTISTLDECCEMAFRYALQNRSAVMHIYHSVNRDLFEESAMRLCDYAVTTYIDTAFPQHQLPPGGDPVHQVPTLRNVHRLDQRRDAGRGAGGAAAYQPPVPRSAGAHHRAQPGRPLKI